MKKFLFAAIALIAFQFSNAQSFAKGDKFLEGTFRYTDNEESQNFTISPKFGYFLSDKFALGAEVNVAGGNKDAEAFGAGVFGRYYFFSIGEHLRVYSQAGVNTFNQKSTSENTTSAGVGLGLNYFISKNLSLTFDVSSLASYSNTEGASTTSFGFDGVNNPLNAPSFGLNYRF